MDANDEIKKLEAKISDITEEEFIRITRKAFMALEYAYTNKFVNNKYNIFDFDSDDVIAHLAKIKAIKGTVIEMIETEMYKEKYWRYIQEHSRAGISPTKSMRPSLQLIFGELFVVLKYGAETLRTKLSDIEKM